MLAVNGKVKNIIITHVKIFNLITVLLLVYCLGLLTYPGNLGHGVDEIDYIPVKGFVNGISC